MASSSICSNSIGCAVIHELCTNVTEMNTKLANVFDILQFFFDSWKASESSKSTQNNDAPSSVQQSNHVSEVPEQFVETFEQKHPSSPILFSLLSQSAMDSNAASQSAMEPNGIIDQSEVINQNQPITEEQGAESVVIKEEEVESEHGEFEFEEPNWDQSHFPSQEPEPEPSGSKSPPGRRKRPSSNPPANNWDSGSPSTSGSNRSERASRHGEPQQKTRKKARSRPPAIIDGGFKHVFDRCSETSSTEYWRCEQKSKGCTAKLHLKNSRVVKRVNEHNHPPERRFRNS